MGFTRTETSTSAYGPPGATTTLKAFCTARWTSTRLPLGAPSISSTPQRPSTVVHPSAPPVSKSNRRAGGPPGTGSSPAPLGRHSPGPAPSLPPDPPPPPPGQPPPPPFPLPPPAHTQTHPPPPS